MKNFVRSAFFLFMLSALGYSVAAQVTAAGTPASGNQTNTISGFIVPAGNNRLLVVTASDGDALSISGATFNGTPMVKRREVSDGFISCDAIFTLSLGNSASPVTGNVVFTSANPFNVTKFISAAAFTKVNQAAPFSDIKSGFANAGSSSLTVAGVAGDLVFDIFDSWNFTTSGAQVPGSGQTAVSASGGLNFGAGMGFGFYSTGRKTAGTSVTTSWSAAGHSAYIHIAVNIKQDNIVLPLKLVSFTGTADSKNAVLNWVTADEINTSHTEIERSSNGTDFSFLAQVGKTVKSYTDLGALDSKMYYRLKLVDIGGNFSYSPEIAVQGKNDAHLITAITPLFASGRIAVSFNLPRAGVVSLQLSDLSGNTVRKIQFPLNKGTGTRYMEGLQSLSSGVYLLQVICGEERLTQKLIK